MLAISAAAAAVSCGSTISAPIEGPHGETWYQLDCHEQGVCVHEANRLCGPAGYEVMNNESDPSIHTKCASTDFVGTAYTNCNTRMQNNRTMLIRCRT